MAIIKQELYTIQCDNCKCVYSDDDSGIGFWLYKSDVWENAETDGWAIEINIIDVDKHYCPKCHRYNEDDELQINIQESKT